VAERRGPGLAALAAYWLGLAVLWGGLSTIVIPELVSRTVDEAIRGTSLAVVAALQALVSILVQPVAGSASDQIVTRFGRRRPWMAIGVSIQVVFVAALAAAGDYLSIIVFVLLIEVCSNLAQGPYQGLLPDLVPPSRRGLASGILGAANMAGSILGAAVAGILVAQGSIAGATIMTAVAIWLGMAGTVIGVREPVPAAAERAAAARSRPRLGRIVRNTWKRDILRERGYLWLLASRLAFLMGAATLQPFMLFYLRDSLGLGSDAATAVAPVAAVVAFAAVLAAIPAGAMTARYGRIRIVEISGLVGMLGALLFAIAPSFEALFLIAIPFGVAIGAFMSADWALLADTVPEGQAGRYFGLSNTVTAVAALLAVLLAGPVADIVNATQPDPGLGYRAIWLLAAAEFLLAARWVRRVRAPGPPRAPEAVYQTHPRQSAL
jgi:MFS family permease